MKNQSVVTLLNRVAASAVVILIFWTFVLMITTVFELRVFGANLTESFFLSVFGLLSILVGAATMNVMLNLTAIAQAVQKPESVEVVAKPFRRSLIWALLLAFPLLGGGLFMGDYLSSKKKEQYLVSSARVLTEEYREQLQKVADYSFSRDFVARTAASLKLLSKVDESFPSIMVIVADEIDGKPVFLKFDSWYDSDRKQEPAKVDYVFSTSKEERGYLASVMPGENPDTHFSAYDGYYELYVPITLGARTFVVRLSDRDSHGKIGS